MVKLTAGKKSKTFTKTQTTKKGYSTRMTFSTSAASTAAVTLTVRKKSGKRWVTYAGAAAKLEVTLDVPGSLATIVSSELGSVTMSEEARILVVANKTAATPALIEAVRDRAARGPAKFTLLVPNAAHGLHKLVDPEDQGSSEAEQTIELALPLLEQAAGGPVDAHDRRARAAGRDPGRDQHPRLRRADHLDAAAAGLEVAQARPAVEGRRARACRPRP